MGKFVEHFYEKEPFRKYKKDVIYKVMSLINKKNNTS